MRLLDNETTRALTNVSLYLTRAEATQLVGYLGDLLAGGGHHCHLFDDEYARELTVAVYSPEILLQSDERSQRLITESSVPQASIALPGDDHGDVLKRLENAEAEVLHLHEQVQERHRAYEKAVEAWNDAQKRIRSLERQVEKLRGDQ